MKTAPLLDRRSLVRAAGLLAVLALVLAGWSGYRSRSQPVRLAGESVASTSEFALRAGTYALSAALLPGCQYTFYLTPAGGLWNRQGRAVASASGERSLSGRTAPLPAGRYFVHAYTAPEEGCSWSLDLRPLP